MAGPLAKLWNRDWAVGIGGRMFLAFGTTSALVLAAAIVGWLGFAKVAQKQQSVVHEALPAMIAAQTLAKVNAQIVTAAPALTSATGNQERQTAYDEISSQTRALNTLLTRIGQFDFDSERISDLKRTVDSIASILAKQNELVARRLRSTRRLEETTAESLQAAAELSDISRSLVANSAATTTAVISSLYDLVEAPDQTEPLLEAFDRLVEVDVDSMERMIQLQLGSAVLGGYINQLNSESDPPSVGFLEHEYRNTLTILARRIEDINDPGRQRQAKTLMRRLTAFGAAAGPEGIFDLRRNILEIGLELERLNERNRALGAALNTIVSDLVVDATEAIDRATEEAETAVTQGRTAFLSITIFSLVIAALILWLYVQRSVVRRLALLDGTMRALAGGDYSAEIKATGNDELTKMTETVRVFRDNAIEKTQLEQERERVASELRSYQRDLEKLVTDRTTQLEEANVRLAEEAGRHRAARNAAEQASQAKTAFLATMSHEIRTPMSGILGTLRLLKGDALSEQQRQYVDLVSSAGEALLVLLNDILDYSKIETGQPELEYSDFDLRVLIGEMEALMRPAAQEHNIHLSTNIAVDVPTALSGAPGRLRQILFNLIGNAVKFTPRGQILVRVQCAETNPDQGLRLRFEVTDTGIGIAAEYRDKVFEAFTQVDSSLSRSYGGAGLGLAICKRLTTAMGGDIGIGPTPTGGTLVWCELPFMAATLPQQSAAANTLAASSATTDPLAVLLVEDNEINQLVVTAYLESQSHTVTLARNGAEAVDRCRRNHFDAVLMDISMPGTDGLEATRQIREIPDPEKSSIPIIAMSAHVFQEEVEQYLAAGMDGFLGKPINPERLRSVLFDVVQKHIDTVSLPSPAADGKAPLVDPDVLAQDLEALGKQRVVELVTTFLASTRRTLDSLLRAMDRGDLKQVGADAHSLKGAAASVGLVEMHEHLHTLESAARRGQGDEASRLAAGLETLHQASCHALESALNHLIANTHEAV